MPAVLRSSRLRPLIGIALSVLTAAAMLLPPSHIHVGEDHDHDHGAVEHSHWAPHVAASRTSIDDDDGQAIFVDHPGILTATHVNFARPLPPNATLLALVEPPALARHADRLAGNAPRDGPHLDFDTLRGPPLV